MCIVFFGFQVLEKLPFLLASNRDEFWSRETQPLHWWRDDHDNDGSEEHHQRKADTSANGVENLEDEAALYRSILAGRDLQQGGTWLGLQRQTHRFAVVTNFREPQNGNQ